MPGYNICLALMSHVFGCDLRRGAGSGRLWALTGAMYGVSLGLAHLMLCLTFRRAVNARLSKIKGAGEAE